MKTAVIGLGYVGLPLSLQFARSCVTVLGLDIDAKKVQLLNDGQSYIKHIEPSTIAELVRSGKFSASSDFSRIREVEAVVICVPTPLSTNREPDISFILETGRAIAPYLVPDRTPHPKPLPGRGGEGERNPQPKLVVLQSTTYPGTTDEDLRAVLEEGSHMKAGVDFHLAFSPEREDPGNDKSKVRIVPKVIGGYTPACLERAKSLYGQVVERLVPSPPVA
jgi:UDP-N-acetyl-D-glucosamine dehydrogenase